MYAAHPPRYQHGIGVRARRKDTFFLRTTILFQDFFESSDVNSDVNEHKRWNILLPTMAR